MADTPPTPIDEDHAPPLHPTIDAMMTISMRSHAFLGTIPKEEVDFSTSLIMGERTEEIPGRFFPLEAPTRPSVIVLPALRTPGDYATAPCKHACAILKLSRHVRQAYAVWKDGAIMQRALMLSRAGQCGLNTAKAGLPEVVDVANMDRTSGYEHMDLNESTLYSASTLNLYGLPYDFASLQSLVPPSRCLICYAVLTGSMQPEPLHMRLFTSQSHLGRCRGDGRCFQAHEIVKLSLKRLALSNADPGGVAIPSGQLLIEQRHMRSDDSRPGYLYALAGGLHAKDAAMDLMVSSSLNISTVLHTSKSSDYALRLA